MIISAIADSLSADVLATPEFITPATHVQQTEGQRNQYGEWVEGTPVETTVDLVSAPVTGQERLVLPEAIRDEDVRTFWLRGDHPSLRYGISDGDLLIMGKLGREQNQFSGDTRDAAESARETYGTANADWLLSYQSGDGILIQLNGFGRALYERYDVTNGRWVLAETYRAVTADRWGSFTEVLGRRIDPGNI